MRSGGEDAIADFIEVFYNSGGRWREDKKRYYSQCRMLECGHTWISYDSSKASKCPKCKSTGWQYGPTYYSVLYGIKYDSSLAAPGVYADNARQSEVRSLQTGIRFDLDRCRNFINWDDKASVERYGHDKHRDIRLGTNGALVQTREPILCLTWEDLEERRAIKIIRCTGRMLSIPVPD